MKFSLRTLLMIALAGALAAPTTAQNAKQPAKSWRTPWGDPDLQGSWSNATTTPLQRPARYGNREFLTREERARQDKETTIGTDRRTEAGTPDDVNGAYNQFWWERGWSDGRTSLIYDPPDGRIPPLTPEAQKRIAAQPKPIPLEARADVLDQAAYNGPEDVELYTRCIVRAALPRVPTGYDNNYQIVQSPGYVAITQEQIHETRIIPLDGRQHLEAGVGQWLGDSRGHWEGDTLVVETTNFSGQVSFEGATKDMRLVERWTRAGDDRIDYRFTVSDSATWTKPWSAAIAWTKTGMLYEYACHEDNYGLYGILAGARAKEHAAAK